MAGLSSDPGECAGTEVCLAWRGADKSDFYKFANAVNAFLGVARPNHRNLEAVMG